MPQEPSTDAAADETPEGEAGDPSPESADDGDEGDEEAPDPGLVLRKVKGWRNDQYRRISTIEQSQSSLDAKMDRILQALEQPKPGTRSDEPVDPVKLRQKIAQDPVAAFRDIAKEEALQVQRAAEAKSKQERAVGTLFGDYPELKNPNHPFHAKVIEEARELEANGNAGPDMLIYAAERANRKYPELRDEAMKDSRRKAVENGSKRAATTSVDHGAKAPAQGKEPKFTEQEMKTARRYGIDLKDEKQRARFAAERDAVRKARIDLPADEDD